MAFLVSPGVETKEVDLTGIVPAVSTSIGAYAGKFPWGPVDQVVNVSDEKDLGRNFGTPTKAFARSYFTAASFLRYSSTLLVSRAVSAEARNASSGELDGYEENFLIKNLDGFEAVSASTHSANFYARYPGDVGNSIKVMIQPAGIQTRFQIVDIVVNESTGKVTLEFADERAAVAALGTLEDGLEVSIRDVRSNGDMISDIENSRLWIGNLDPTGDAVGGVYTVTADLYTDSGLTALFDARDYSNTVVTASGYAFAPVEVEDFNNTFVTAPGTSAYAEKYGAANDEINVLIIDEAGKFSGTPGTILEIFGNISVAIDAKKENGETNYYKDIINRSSKYIYVDNLTGIISGADASIKEGGASFEPAYNTGGSIFQVSFAGGTDGDLEATDGVYDALEFFEDAETYDVNLLFAENDTENAITIANRLIRIAEARKDCLAFISPAIEVKDQATEDDKLDKVLAKFNRLASTSYAVFDSSPLYIYDKYNDEYIWIPACGMMAGLCARTDNARDPWWSPAGFNRGQLLGVAKLAFNPRQNARDELYKSRVNPIVSFPGEGIVLYGDKTALAKPSAFDRINVRRLFIVLEKAIATAAKYQLFEFNDEFTRAQFKNMVDPYLRDIQGRRGITDFRTVCDETNNTGEVIDSNRFVGDIYVKPTRSINFITLNFVATRTGIEFSEIIGQF